MDELASQQDLYDRLGFSDRVGLGTSPAVLVIDMCRGITEPGHPLSIAMDSEVTAIRDLLDLARRVGTPVVFTTVGYAPDGADGGVFVQKIPLLRTMVSGDPLTMVDPRLAPEPGDLVVEKKYPSAFAGTPVQAFLTSRGIDSLVVVGNSTSGCVRATVVDGISNGYRVVVPDDCVADRAALSHRVALFDLDAKYCDVMPSAAVHSLIVACAAGVAP